MLKRNTIMHGNRQKLTTDPPSMMLNALDATWVVLLPGGECVGYFRTGSGPSLFILCDANKKSCSSQGNNHSYQNIQIGCESFSRITTPLNLF